MKVCTKCGVEKPLDFFYRDARCADGRYSACKDCAQEATKAWKQANASSVAEYQRDYRLADPQAVAVWMREWRARNKDKLRGYWERWNPVCNAKRRAAKKQATCDCCAPISFRFIYLQARSLGMHVDHLQPLAKGGKHCLRNLQLLEPIDNLRKGTRYAEA